MMSEKPNQRPNCEEILESYKLWTLSEIELNAEKVFEKALNSSQNEESYVFKLIKKRITVPESWVTEYTQDSIRREIIECDITEKLTDGLYGYEKRYFEGENCLVKKIKIYDQREEEFMKDFENLFSITQLNSERLVKYSNVSLQHNISKKNGLVIYEKSLTLEILMEFCGQSLRDIIREIETDLCLKQKLLTPLGFYLSSELFAEILEGVNYLHENHIIHGDLNLDNILLKIGYNKSFVKIAETGLTDLKKYSDMAEANPKPTSSQNIRKFSSSAPEVVNGRKPDKKTDIYSLGHVLQQLFFIAINKL